MGSSSLVLLLVLLVGFGGFLMPKCNADPNVINVLLSDWISDIGSPNEPIDDDYILVDFNMFLAVEHFNQRNTSIYPALANIPPSCTKTMQVVRFCDESASPRRAALLTKEHQGDVDAIVGFASTATSFSSVVAETQVNVPVVSHWCSSGRIANTYESPLFSRVMLADDQYSEIAASFIVDTMKFKQVQILFVQYDSAIELQFSVSASIINKGKQVSSFGYDLEDEDSIRTALTHIKNSEITAVFIIAYRAEVPIIAKVAGELDMLGDEYFYMFSNLDIIVNPEEAIGDRDLVKLLNGAVYIMDGIKNSTMFENYLPTWPDNKNLLTSINSKLPPQGSESVEQLSCENDMFNLQTTAERFDEFHKSQDVWARAYDAVMIVGIAGCAAGVDHTNGTQLHEKILESDFDGMSGRINFEANGNRRLDTLNFNVINYRQIENSDVLIRKIIGTYDIESLTFVIDSRIFHTKGNLQPFEYLPVQENHQYLPLSLAILGFVLYGIGSLFVLICFIFVHKFRSYRVIYTSQGELIKIILFGILIMLVSILFAIVDDNPERHLNPNRACNAGPSFFLIGSFLALITFIVRSNRIYVIFTSKGLRRLDVSMKRSVSIIFGTSFFYSMLVVIWAVFVPLTWSREVTERNRFGLVLVSYGKCTGSTGSLVYGATLLAIDFFALLYSLISIYKVRKLPEEFQEARYIIVSTVAVIQLFIMCISTLAAVYSTSVEGRFVILSLFVFVSGVIQAGFLVIPKMKAILATHYETSNLDKNGSRVDNFPNRSGSNLKTSSNNVNAGDLNEIDAALHLTHIRSRFEKFAETHFLTESYHFICDIHSWQSEYSRNGGPWRHATAVSIYQIYIAREAMLQVNLPSHVREDIERELSKATETNPPRMEIFSAAHKEILLLLEQNSWPKFVSEGGLYGVMMTSQAQPNVSRAVNQNLALSTSNSLQPKMPVRIHSDSQ